ncbi:MAG: DUF2851 family protein [Candidatus Tectimicrobiota bacterium]
MFPGPFSWHTCYPALSDADWVAETPAAWQHTIPEKLVRCLWFDQRWRPTGLCTLEGQALLVHTPGRWNAQAGPDFQQAHIEFVGEARRQGDVEIHCYASGWTAHRHHRDPRYNNVILHVFLWNDRQAPTAHRADGTVLPQLALADYLPYPLAEYQAAISLAEYPYKTGYGHGQCYRSLQVLPLQEVQDFLSRAGDTRLQQRAWRWASRAEEVGLTQVMYEAVLRSLGSAGYRQRFQDLARLVPWQEVQPWLDLLPAAERGLASEALLLGLAGIGGEAFCGDDAADEVSQHYTAQLHYYWQRLPLALRQRAWHNVNWRQPGGRPTNTPERRLAGMARLLAHLHGRSLFDTALGLCQAMPGNPPLARVRALCRDLSMLLQVPGESYWSRRVILGSPPGKAQRLIGASRALTVVVDAILPVLLLAAQQRADTALRATVLALYAAAPSLPDNQLLRYMRHRALGNAPALLALLTGARQQQGLLQLFMDCCGNDEGDCQGCAFPLA